MSRALWHLRAAALAGSFGGALAFAWLGSLFGLLLGLVGLAQRGHKRGLAAWGAVLNGLLFLGPLVGMLLSSAATR